MDEIVKGEKVAKELTTLVFLRKDLLVSRVMVVI